MPFTVWSWIHLIFKKQMPVSAFPVERMELCRWGNIANQETEDLNLYLGSIIQCVIDLLPNKVTFTDSGWIFEGHYSNQDSCKIVFIVIFRFLLNLSRWIIWYLSLLGYSCMSSIYIHFSVYFHSWQSYIHVFSAHSVWTVVFNSILKCLYSS